MILQQNLSTAMNALRQQRQQSVSSLSKDLGIAKSSLQEILDGNGNPQIETVERIASQLSISPVTLLSCAGQGEQVQRGLFLLQNIQAISRLPQAQQHELAAVFYQMVTLLEPTL